MIIIISISYYNHVHLLSVWCYYQLTSGDRQDMRSPSWPELINIQRRYQRLCHTLVNKHVDLYFFQYLLYFLLTSLWLAVKFQTKRLASDQRMNRLAGVDLVARVSDIITGRLDPIINSFRFTINCNGGSRCQRRYRIKKRFLEKHQLNDIIIEGSQYIYKTTITILSDFISTSIIQIFQ